MPHVCNILNKFCFVYKVPWLQRHLFKKYNVFLQTSIERYTGRGWVTQVYLYQFYLPELIRLVNDVETNPGPTSDFNKIGQMHSSLCIFSPLSETSQSFLCSKMKLPLVVKHCKKSVKVHLSPNTISTKMQTLSCSKSDLTFFLQHLKFFRATVPLEICYQLVHDRAGEGHGSISTLTSQTDLHACSQRVNAM